MSQVVANVLAQWCPKKISASIKRETLPEMETLKTSKS